ncbi:MAG TPA: cobalamin-independent methionine synthase II family protein [Candidatus Tectomicrobia bacterium]|nr:cobalamin-independent methionine synthase II family protein [Candidatus Tectomicrobia bacterium]
MKRSSQRILTTFVGSLARPSDLIDLMKAKEHGQPYDHEGLSRRVRSAVGEVVRRQAAAGIDIVTDGEQGKPGFVAYVSERLAGFETRATSPREGPWVGSREEIAFPEYYEWYARGRPRNVAPPISLVCSGPITYKGQQALQTDIDNLKAALQGVQVEEAFMPASSPTNIESQRKNEYYPTQEAYLYAIADAMRDEYRGIIDAGFVLQIDDPRLVTYYVANPGLTVAQCRKWAELRVEVLNYALRDVPAEQVRFHTCYGINIGPRVHEMPLQDIVDIMLKVHAGAYSFEAANPRHEHEWRVWESVKLPEGKVLIPGVISHTTNLVEHPELVAERLMRYANIVGRERVIAGSDCGFSSQATSEPEIHPTVVWAKFQALAEGARLASQQLWGRRTAIAGT